MRWVRICMVVAMLLLSVQAEARWLPRWAWPWGRRVPPSPSYEEKPTPVKEKVAPAISVDKLEKMAKDGNDRAQVTLGKMYFDGVGGVKQDYAKAAEYFRRAAEQGNSLAEFNYGICLDTGRGVRQDPEQALQWYVKAAEKGVMEARLNAAVMLEKRNDTEKALEYYRIAADSGNPLAMRKVATMYMAEGQSESRVAAGVLYLRDAARRGDVRAQVMLADCYQTGRGVSRDYQEMLNWLWLAAQD
jgi:hypothetical protein